MYAADTKVPIERTRAAIELLLRKFKCTQYTIGADHERHTAMVQFRAANRIVRFLITLPQRGHFGSEQKYEQAERQRWRALLLVIKAKLEAVENKIATFEEEFLAHIVMPNDQTVATIITPLIARAYDTGQLPPQLLQLPAGRGEAQP